MKELLIVGAGITGSLTAALLSRAHPASGAAVTIWDKARGAGGRMSTHRYQNLQVDMGAQYVSHFKTEGSEEYEQLKYALYQELLSKGVLVPFSGTIEGERKDLTQSVLHNYVSPKGLNAIAKHFMKSSIATTSFQNQLAKMDINSSEGSDTKGCTIRCTTNGLEATFDAVILTMPVPQILALSGNFLSTLQADVRLNLAAVRYSSRYALGLCYDAAAVSAAPEGVFDSKWSVRYLDNPIIRYASWDTGKRGADLDVGRTLLAHSSVPFGVENLETDKEEVKDIMVERLGEIIPGLPVPTHMHIIRWRYSQVSQVYPGSPGCVVLSHDPLVVATGDGFTGSNFENCIRAAQATTNVLKSVL